MNPSYASISEASDTPIDLASLQSDLIKLQELYQYEGEGGHILQVHHPSESVSELNTTTDSGSEACQPSTVTNSNFKYGMIW